MIDNELSDVAEEYFSIGDVVSFSANIEISHVNDNRAPMKDVIKKSMLWVVLAATIAAIFFS